MMNKIEDFLLNRFAGKLLARAAVTVTGLIVGKLVPVVAAHTGISIQLDPAEVQGAIIMGAHAVYEYFKARRMANPNSPAIQTDPSKMPPAPIPGA